MTHIGALNEENHVFSDIGGVVGNALEVASDKHQVDAAAYDCRVRLHIAHKLVVNRIPHLINCVVRLENTAGETGIPLDEGVETVAKHRLHKIGHLWQIDQGFD